MRPGGSGDKLPPMSSQDGSRTAGATITLALRALRHRNFRLFSAGQFVSLIGTWMQQVAVGWLVYRLTGSAFYLGVVGFASQAPAFLLAPIAGALADRVNKHRLVIGTQIFGMLQAAVLAILVLSGRIEVWHIVLLMTWLGCVTGFDVPARQSFLLEMVGDRADLPNAIALNSSMFNAARLVGPAIAGLAISVIGEGMVILANALSYIAVLASLMMMRIPRRPKPRTRPHMLAHINEGFRYAFGSPPIRSILLMLATVSLVAVPFTVLLPVVATEVLDGDARTLGFLMGATGLGALTGALYLASRSTVRGLGRVIVGASSIFGLGLIGVALSRSLLLSLSLLMLAGFGMMTQMASSNTVLQTLVDDDKRGRVMSLYSMAFLGTAPIGSLLAGAIASRWGAPVAIGAGGACCIAASAVFGTRIPVLREYVRPIYERLGILPEVARGIQAATHNATPETDADDDDAA